MVYHYYHDLHSHQIDCCYYFVHGQSKIIAVIICREKLDSSSCFNDGFDDGFDDGLLPARRVGFDLNTHSIRSTAI